MRALTLILGLSLVAACGGGGGGGSHFHAGDDAGTNLAPDLAVEIVSPSDRLNDVEEKVDLYLNNGTRLVWVISPRSRRATVYRLGQQPRVLKGTDALVGEDVLPGFSCILNSSLTPK